MLLFVLLYSVFFFPVAVLAAFGWTDNGSEYVIDSGADLVIKVTKCCGDISSLRYKGVEYQGYGGKNSHVESGLGPSAVSIQTYSSPGYVIKVSVTRGTLKHWIFVRYKNNNVYLFTNKADTSISAMRYIVRIKGGMFPHSSSESDFYDNGSQVIEAGDINRNAAGHTKSKHYSGETYGRTMDYHYVGRSTGSVGLWVVRSNHEKASGGPFFRSLLRRADTGGEDLYDIYYYNMGSTDPMRFGVQGPTVITFTNGEPPNQNLFADRADWGWFDTLGIDGWTPWGQRGYAAGVGLANMKAGYPYVVGLSNPNAQYWGVASYSNGAWSIRNVLPGTYTVTVYKDELEVATSTVTVQPGVGAAVNTITCRDPSDTVAVWRIGNWDGTPRGFLNFQDQPMKPTYMHPSDSRIATWNPGGFIVGTSSAGQFPGYMWQQVNNDQVVYFRLNADQLKQGRTIRIGITQAYINGRPTIKVNNWASRLPGATNQASTRSLTVGTYRGNNVMLTFDVPASAWIQSTSEWQVLTVSVVTGSTGSGFLSGGVSFDCLDMI